jgi:hypothetical protein
MEANPVRNAHLVEVRISEFITQLQQILKDRGDLQLYVEALGRRTPPVLEVKSNKFSGTIAAIIHD